MLKNSYVLNHTSIPSLQWSFVNRIILESLHGRISKAKKAAGAASTKYMKIAKKMGAELVVYDNVTNDVYMQDLVNGRTDVIVNDYYLQKMAVAAIKDKYPVKINDGIYSNPYSTSFTFSLKNKNPSRKVNTSHQERDEERMVTLYQDFREILCWSRRYRRRN